MSKMQKSICGLGMILVLACTVPAAWAQQKDPRLSQPIPPLPPIGAGESSSKSADDPAAPTPAANAAQPDNSPLSGVQDFTLGSMGGGRSYLVPSIRFAMTAGNDLRTPTSVGDWSSAGLLSGSLALQRLWGRHQLTLDYSGGHTLFTTTSWKRQSFHSLNFTETIAWRRTSIMFADNFTYLPQASFGFGGIAGIGVGLGSGLGIGGLGAGLGGLGNGLGNGLVPGINPSQSIIAGLGRRASNSTVGQLQYQFTPRASVTVAASYGFLRFLDPGFIDSHSYNYQAGYDYKITSRDTLGVIYGYSSFSFDGYGEHINDHNVHIAYSRKITGRLALRLAGGPQFSQFTIPTIGHKSNVAWSTRSTLLYTVRGTDYSIAYLRGVTAGSGVLLGANTDRVDGNIHRRLTRMWTGGIRLGYAHNSSIHKLTTGSFDRRFDTWNAGVDFRRPVGRKAKLFFTYNLQGQRTNPLPGCTSVACSSFPTRHTFGLGLDWSFGPYALD